MRNKLIASVFVLYAPFCFASHAGFYLGADIGYGFADYRSIHFSKSFLRVEVNHDDGAVPKFNFGYAINSYFGAEVGVVYFSRPAFWDIVDGRKLDEKFSIKHDLVYFATKISWPFAITEDRFAFYAKLGVGYVVRSDIKLWTTHPIHFPEPGQYVRPVYGLGADFLVTEHWGLDASWLQAPKRTQDQMPVSNFYGVGAFYRF